MSVMWVASFLQVAKFQIFGLVIHLLNKREFVGLLVVANENHAACLTAEHTKHLGLLRWHKLADTDTEGAILFLHQILAKENTVVFFKSTLLTILI